MNMQTVPEASRVLDVPEWMIRRAVREGQLRSLMLGRRMLVDLDEARRALESRRGLVGIREVCEATGLHATAVRRGIQEGWIPARWLGNAWLMRLEDVEKAIEQRMK